MKKIIVIILLAISPSPKLQLLTQSICDFMCTFISVLFFFFFFQQYQVGCRKDIALKNRVFTAQNQYVHKKGHFFMHSVSYFGCAIEEWGFCTVSISQNTKEELKGFLLLVSSCDMGGL